MHKKNNPVYLVLSILDIRKIHCVKSVRIRSFSCPYFPTFAFSRSYIEDCKLHTHYLLFLIRNIILLINLANFGSLIIKVIQLVLVFHVDSYGMKLLLLFLLESE